MLVSLRMFILLACFPSSDSNHSFFFHSFASLYLDWDIFRFYSWIYCFLSSSYSQASLCSAALLCASPIWIKAYSFIYLTLSISFNFYKYSLCFLSNSSYAFCSNSYFLWFVTLFFAHSVSYLLTSCNRSCFAFKLASRMLWFIFQKKISY